MKKILLAVLLVFALSLPSYAAFMGIAPEKVDKMAIDPQSFTLYRDADWSQLKPNPVMDWKNDYKDESLYSTLVSPAIRGRKIRGGLVMFDYLDRKFVSAQDRGSDLLGYYLMNKNLVDYGDGRKGGSYSPDFVKNPMVTIKDFPEGYPNGYADLPKFWGDQLNYPYNIDGDIYTGKPFDPSKPDNKGMTINGYWLEASSGKWGVELFPTGPYTIPFFEFEVMTRDGYSTWRDVPPSFRYGSPSASGNPANSGSGALGSNNGDSHCIEVARYGGATNSPNYGLPKGLRGLSEPTATNFSTANMDFSFMLHAGYAESGVWEEFGQMQYATRKEIPWDLGPGNRLLNTEKFFSEYPEWIPVYEQRYRTGWANNTAAWNNGTATGNSRKFDQNNAEVMNRINTVYRAEAFWTAELARYNAWVAAGRVTPYVFKLPQEDWDWANAYHGKAAEDGRPDDNSVWDGNLDYLGIPPSKNTRYIQFAPWEAIVGEWSHATSNTGGTGWGSTGRGTTLRFSNQGENTGMGTFAHEFSHIAGLSDNYVLAWTYLSNNKGDYWDIMGAGDKNGPYGTHTRWMIPGIFGGTVPSVGMANPSSMWGFYDSGDLLEIRIDDLAARTPMVANVVANNVPLDTAIYDMGVPRYNPATGEGFVKALRLNFIVTPTTGPWSDQAIRTTGWTWFHAYSGQEGTTVFTDANGKARHYYIAAIDRSGHNSYLPDTGVLIERVWNTSNVGHAVIHSHLYDNGLTDFVVKNENGENETYNWPAGHAAQLVHAAFKVGKSYTDTGYYRTVRDYDTRMHDIVKRGSEWRWEPRDGRPILAGDSVNEWRDEANKLHFYILEKQYHPGKYGDFLSYKVGLRHDNGAKVDGALELKVKEGSEAMSVKVGTYTKQTYLVTNTGATTNDIIRVELMGAFGENQSTTEIVDMTTRSNATTSYTAPGTNQTGTTAPLRLQTRIIPTYYSERNAFVLNDLYSIAPGETVEFDVYIKQAAENTMGNLADLLTVRVVSESNDNNFALLSVNGKQIVDVTPIAVVEKLNGNKNNLHITVIVDLSFGESIVLEKTFSIDNNSAGTYTIDPFKVYVDTKGNTQIRACYIVNN